MNTSLIHLPAPRIPVSIRPGTMNDLPFIDSLQKKHTKQVGWFSTKTIEGKIRAGHVLIAEEGRDEETKRQRDEVEGSEAAHFVSSSLRLSVSSPLGYLIGTDRYFKHDNIGIIYQINIAEGKRRSLVGATLLKAQFDRSAYGCKLYCCWCAQDIEGNRFWESMGFVPLAFRTGSRGKGRIHIFWQRRIRAGDTTTEYWFPSQTSGGCIGEDRLVLPIPPGTHWSDAKPIILPQGELPQTSQRQIEGPKKGPREVRQKVQSVQPGGIGFGFLQFKSEKKPKTEKPPRPKREKQKNDPKLVAAAREIRDRSLEYINENPLLANGKYDLSRAMLPEPDRKCKQIAIEVVQPSRALPGPVAA